MESKGRVGLFELMEMTVAVTVLIITKPSSIATKKSAITQNGFKTMRQEGLTKAAGTTNVGVVFRATQEADGI
jgi:type II secretory ATPase GspE/PulE/Tfp pilus assembly ATPase PilB-like protein